MRINCILWHEMCIKNMRSHLDLLVKERDRVVERVRSAQAALDLYERQAKEARRRGMTSFDPARFLVKSARRKPPSVR